ncbi:hypothetical protein O9929_18505 [Vibrio lentus]|nr:hypothetical protein [Vibrio lentus]
MAETGVNSKAATLILTFTFKRISAGKSSQKVKSQSAKKKESDVEAFMDKMYVRWVGAYRRR